MTVTLEPKLEREIMQQAAAQGQGEEEYINRLLQSALHKAPPAMIPPTMTQEEFLQSSQELVERAKARNLPVSTSSFRREDIYDDDEGR